MSPELLEAYRRQIFALLDDLGRTAVAACGDDFHALYGHFRDALYGTDTTAEQAIQMLSLLMADRTVTPAGCCASCDGHACE